MELVNAENALLHDEARKRAGRIERPRGGMPVSEMSLRRKRTWYYNSMAAVCADYKKEFVNRAITHFKPIEARFQQHFKARN